MGTFSKLDDLKRQLYDLDRETKEVNKRLNGLADALDDAFIKAGIIKVAASAVAIGGGLITAVGFGLSFFTFGSSLLLAGIGAGISAAGGITAGVAQIVDSVMASETAKEAEEALAMYNQLKERIQSSCLDIGGDLEKHGNIDSKFEYWVKFWHKLVFGIGKAGIAVAWDGVATAVRTYIAASRGMAAGGVEAGVTAAKTIISSAGMALHVVGGVAGVLLMAVDIYTLVDSSIDIHKENSHVVSLDIRAVAKQLTDQCPTTSEIEELIERTKNTLK